MPQKALDARCIGSAFRPTTLLTPRQAALRLAATSGLFVGVYALCNQLTHLRGDIGQAVFEWERAIPFVPWTIVPYLSLIGFFALSFMVRRQRSQRDCHAAAVAIDLLLSAACYLLMPLRFTFDRPLPEGVWGPLFALLGAADLPYNRAPSLHISVLLIVWLRLSPQWQGWKKAAFGIWFVLIALSVLTTYQHHVIDVPTGVLVGAASVALARRTRRLRFALHDSRLACGHVVCRHPGRKGAFPTARSRRWVAISSRSTLRRSTICR